MARLGEMARQSVLAPLLRVPLFAGLKPLQITEIARQAERLTFRAGAVITQVGRPADGAYLIVAGSAERRAPTGSLFLPDRIEPGSLICELAMFVEFVPRSTTVAGERVHCLKITRTALHDQMRSDPSLARHFEDMFIERLRQAATQLRDVDRLLEKRAAAVA